MGNKGRLPEPTVSAPAPPTGVVVVSASQPMPPPPAVPISVAADQFSVLSVPAVAEPHKVAREYALAAAKICDRPSMQPATAGSARRLLRAALALLEE